MPEDIQLLGHWAVWGEEVGPVEQHREQEGLGQGVGSEWVETGPQCSESFDHCKGGIS